MLLKMGTCSSAAETFLAQHILLKSELQQILNLNVEFPAVQYCGMSKGCVMATLSHERAAAGHNVFSHIPTGQVDM